MLGNDNVYRIAGLLLASALIAQIWLSQAVSAQDPFPYTPEEIRSHLTSAIDNTQSHRTVTKQTEPELDITTEALVVDSLGVRFSDSSGFASYCIEANGLVYTQAGEVWIVRDNGGPCVDYWLERLTSAFWEPGSGWRLTEHYFTENGTAILLVFTLGDPGEVRADAAYWLDAGTFLPELSISTTFDGDNDIVQYETEYLDWNAPLSFTVPSEALMVSPSPVPD